MQKSCALHDGVEYSNETDIANSFNRYFSQVADLPNVDPLDYFSRVEQSMYYRGKKFVPIVFQPFSLKIISKTTDIFV